jgi:hypothetical protein
MFTVHCKYKISENSKNDHGNYININFNWQLYKYDC